MKLEQKCTEGNNKSSVPKKCRTYCFTIYEGHNVDRPVYDDTMKYLVFGDEICPTTNRKHIQGYIRFKNPKSFKQVAKRYGDVRKANGTDLENRTYIIGPYDKDDKHKDFNPDAVEYGTISNQGFRTDLEELKNNLVEGFTSVDDIVINDPEKYHQYGRTLHKIEDITLRKKFRTEMTKGIWYHGGTGVGKSHEVFKDYNVDKCYIWKDDNGWQDGYCGQEIVIINDFRGGIKYNELLQMIDKWPHHVRRRNREPSPFLAKEVRITSSIRPEECYSNINHKDNINQLLRRLEIIHIKMKVEE